MTSTAIPNTANVSTNIPINPLYPSSVEDASVRTVEHNLTEPSGLGTFLHWHETRSKKGHPMSESTEVKVAMIMGSSNDWGVMSPGADILNDFGVPHECRVLSAHRTPDELVAYLKDAESRGCQVFIGGAGGAAHLAGVIASKTLKPVLGVPIPSVLQGLDSLLSTVQMPGGIPVGTLAIGKAGATNAALLAVSILGTSDPAYLDKIADFRQKKADKILAEELPTHKGTMGFKQG
jgi:5-(carboxyamino)imidazole ribonucleotide mutase